LDLTKTRHVTDADYIKWTKRVEPTAGDVVFSYETRLGQAAIIPAGLKCCLGRRMGLVRLQTNKILPTFFLFQYLTPVYQNYLRSKIVQGATVDRIHLKQFPDFDIFVPSLGAQKEIIANVEAFIEESEKIETKYARKLKDLDDLRQSLLARAFAGELT
jgi:type I restriction enzyme S subunit